MYRIIISIAICASLVGCGGDKKSTQTQTQADAAGGAQVELSAMDKLNGLSAELQTGVDALMAPINETQQLIDHITAMPARLGIDAKTVSRYVDLLERASALVLHRRIERSIQRRQAAGEIGALGPEAVVAFEILIQKNPLDLQLSQEREAPSRDPLLLGPGDQAGHREY